MRWVDLDRWAKTYGDAFFLFDEERFLSNFHRFRQAFRQYYPKTELGYSYKTNYIPDLCRAVFRAGGYAEVVSEMEYALARHLGIPGNRVIYNGPAKSAASLCAALAEGAIVNLDSLRDLEVVETWVESQNASAFGVGIRCNFPISGRGDSRFGFDIGGKDFRLAVERLRKEPRLHLAGLHCHFPHRDLDSFRERVDHLLLLASQLFDEPPDYLNIGGGYFGDLPPALAKRTHGIPPSFNDYGQAIAGPMAATFPDPQNAPVLFAEPGTALVADAFRFVVRVVSTKRIRGRNIATVAGSIFNVSPHARLRALPVEVVRAREGVAPETEVCEGFDIGGYTCIEEDFLSEAVPGPLAQGDFLCYSNVGSYSIVMKPPFILPGVPVLLIDGSNAEPRVIKEAETLDQVFATFPRFREPPGP